MSLSSLLPHLQPLWGSFPELPHGQVLVHPSPGTCLLCNAAQVFACFMTACLIGGTLVSPILARTRVTAALRNMFAVVAASLLLSAGAETYNCLRFDRVAHFCPPSPPPNLVSRSCRQLERGNCWFHDVRGVLWPVLAADGHAAQRDYPGGHPLHGIARHLSFTSSRAASQPRHHRS